MTPEFWLRLESLFARAIELPAETRSAFLSEACPEDPELRAEIEAMLAEHLAAGRTDQPDRLVNLTRIRPGQDPDRQRKTRAGVGSAGNGGRRRSKGPGQ